MVPTTDILNNCKVIEKIVADMVVRGNDDKKKLVYTVSALYNPITTWEQEIYSEVIIYTRLSILN